MYVIGNWKMNGTLSEAKALAHGVAAYMRKQHADVTCVLCPPAPLLGAVAAWVEDAPRCAVGGQDCHPKSSGAYTGDISAPMLHEVGCSYVILGHSERRQHHGETDALVAKKAEAALAAGLTPVICVGEHQRDYEENRSLAVVEAQVLASVPEGCREPILIAYEPIWAIGAGKIPALREIEAMHGALCAVLLEKKGIAPEQVSVLYGGSVGPDNAREIMRIPDVAGVLVGGASLKVEEFCAIIAAAEE